MSSPTRSSAEIRSLWRLLYHAFAGGYGGAWALLVFLVAVPVAICALVGALTMAPPFPIFFMDIEPIASWLPLLAGLSTGLVFYVFSPSSPAPERFAVALPAGLIATLLFNGAALTILQRPVELVWRPLLGWVFLFSILWSIRAVMADLADMAASRRVLRRMWLRTAGAVAGAALGVAAARYNGADWAWVVQGHCFYVLVVPACMGYGLARRVRGHTPSRLFAATLAFYLLAAALVAVFAPGSQPHEIDCAESQRFGEHRFYGYQGPPWRWHADRPEFWPLAPIGLAELAHYHIVQPRPSCDTP